MTANAADLFLRVCAVTLILFAALLRYRAAPRETATWLFLPLAVGLASFVVDNGRGPSLLANGSLTAANLFAGLLVPFLWWFCLALFDSAFRPGPLVLAVGAAWWLLAFASRGYFGGLDEEAAGLALLVLGISIVIHLAWRLIGERRDDMVEWRRTARWWIVLFLVVLLLVDLVVDIFFGTAWQPDAFAFAQNAAIAWFAVWLGWHSVPPPPPAQAPRPTTPRSPVAEVVDRLIKDQRVYLYPDLDFERFVALTGQSERAVRRHIHHVLGHDHFRAFLNQHRVADALRRLVDPAHDGDKLIAIAFDSGFASLPSFNRVFRNVTGRTPSEVRASRGIEEPSATI